MTEKELIGKKLIVWKNDNWIYISSKDTCARVLIKDALDSNLEGLLKNERKRI